MVIAIVKASPPTTNDDNNSTCYIYLPTVVVLSFSST